MPSITVETKIDFDVRCDNCKEPLEVTIKEDAYSAKDIYVKPCKKCIKDSYDEGYRNGNEQK